MQKARLIVALCLVLAWTCTAQAQAANRSIVVNIPGFTLYLYENGVVIREYPISIGTELKPSIMGETTIINKVTDPTYYPPRWWERGLTPIPPGPNNPVGSRWLGLGFPSYGIHGTNNPDSIGTAASSGCIRMRNSDVEELYSLVQVGTPVRLVYQTVIFGEDPMYGNKTVTIYPDVYSLGSTRRQMEEGLKQRGWWDGVFWPALEKLMEEPSGREECLPLSMSLSFNGQPLGSEGAMVGGRWFVPYASPGRDGMANKELREWGGITYMDVEAYAAQLGLSFEIQGGSINLRSPKAYLGEKMLGPVLTIDQVDYIPVGSLGDVLATQATSLVPQQLTVVSFQGDYYVPLQVVLQYEGEEELRIEGP